MVTHQPIMDGACSTNLAMATDVAEAKKGETIEGSRRCDKNDKNDEDEDEIDLDDADGDGDGKHDVDEETTVGEGHDGRENDDKDKSENDLDDAHDDARGDACDTGHAAPPPQVPSSLPSPPAATDTAAHAIKTHSHANANNNNNNSGKKKQELQARLRALKANMDRSRALNRREVRSEGERLGSHEAERRERRRLREQEKTRRRQEWSDANSRALHSVKGNTVLAAMSTTTATGTATATATGGGDKGDNDDNDDKYLVQSAAHTLAKARRREEKARDNRFEANDYHNPEGQRRNYERGLKSLPPSLSASASVSSSSASTSTLPLPLNDTTYNPLEWHNVHALDSAAAAAAERAGAARLSSELKRRANKSHERRYKRQLADEGVSADSDAVDVTGINKRNKRFNEKIGRNFDKHTAEIRQNLERGTAL